MNQSQLRNINHHIIKCVKTKGAVGSHFFPFLAEGFETSSSIYTREAFLKNIKNYVQRYNTADCSISWGGGSYASNSRFMRQICALCSKSLLHAANPRSERQNRALCGKSAFYAANPRFERQYGIFFLLWRRSRDRSQ